jgi:hypothetical protein
MSLTDYFENPAVKGHPIETQLIGLRSADPRLEAWILYFEQQGYMARSIPAELLKIEASGRIRQRPPKVGRTARIPTPEPGIPTAGIPREQLTSPQLRDLGYLLRAGGHIGRTAPPMAERPVLVRSPGFRERRLSSERREEIAAQLAASHAEVERTQPQASGLAVAKRLLGALMPRIPARQRGGPPTPRGEQRAALLARADEEDPRAKIIRRAFREEMVRGLGRGAGMIPAALTAQAGAMLRDPLAVPRAMFEAAESPTAVAEPGPGPVEILGAGLREGGRQWADQYARTMEPIVERFPRGLAHPEEATIPAAGAGRDIAAESEIVPLLAATQVLGWPLAGVARQAVAGTARKVGARFGPAAAALVSETAAGAGESVIFSAFAGHTDPVDYLKTAGVFGVLKGGHGVLRGVRFERQLRSELQRDWVRVLSARQAAIEAGAIIVEPQSVRVNPQMNRAQAEAFGGWIGELQKFTGKAEVAIDRVGISGMQPIRAGAEVMEGEIEGIATRDVARAGGAAIAVRPRWARAAAPPEPPPPAPRPEDRMLPPVEPPRALPAPETPLTVATARQAVIDYLRAQTRALAEKGQREPFEVYETALGDRIAEATGVDVRQPLPGSERPAWVDVLDMFVDEGRVRPGWPFVPRERQPLLRRRARGRYDRPLEPGRYISWERQLPQEFLPERPPVPEAPAAARRPRAALPAPPGAAGEPPAGAPPLRPEPAEGPGRPAGAPAVGLSAEHLQDTRVALEQLQRDAEVSTADLEALNRRGRGEATLTDQHRLADVAAREIAAATNARRILEDLSDQDLRALMSRANEEAVARGENPLALSERGAQDYAAQEWLRRQGETAVADAEAVQALLDRLTGRRWRKSYKADIDKLNLPSLRIFLGRLHREGTGIKPEITRRASNYASNRMDQLRGMEEAPAAAPPERPTTRRAQARERAPAEPEPPAGEAVALPTEELPGPTRPAPEEPLWRRPDAAEGGPPGGSIEDFSVSPEATAWVLEQIPERGGLGLEDFQTRMVRAWGEEGDAVVQILDTQGTIHVLPGDMGVMRGTANVDAMRAREAAAYLSRQHRRARQRKARWELQVEHTLSPLTPEQKAYLLAYLDAPWNNLKADRPQYAPFKIGPELEKLIRKRLEAQGITEPADAAGAAVRGPMPRAPAPAPEPPPAEPAAPPARPTTRRGQARQRAQDRGQLLILRDLEQGSWAEVQESLLRDIDRLDLAELERLRGGIQKSGLITRAVKESATEYIEDRIQQLRGPEVAPPAAPPRPPAAREDLPPAPPSVEAAAEGLRRWWRRSSERERRETLRDTGLPEAWAPEPDLDATQSRLLAQRLQGATGAPLRAPTPPPVSPPARGGEPPAAPGYDPAIAYGEPGGPPPIIGYYTMIAEDAPGRTWVTGQRGPGTYVALDRPWNAQAGKLHTAEVVGIRPEEVLDPNGLLEGTNRAKSRADWEEAGRRYDAMSPAERNRRGGEGFDAGFRTMQSIWKEQGYKAQVGEIEPGMPPGPENPGRELVVWERENVQLREVPDRRPPPEPTRPGVGGPTTELPPQAPPGEAGQLQRPPPKRPGRIPPMVTGKQGKARTEAGSEANVVYSLIEAEDVVASHTTQFQPDSRFWLREGQVRDRSAANLRRQAEIIDTQMDPSRLGEWSTTNEGAPIVDPYGHVVGGSGRVIGIKRHYRRGAPVYRQWLEANAEQFGLRKADVQAMREPILVRRARFTKSADQIRFAQETDIPSTATRRPSERAQADANQVTPETLGMYVPASDLNSASNRAFVRRYFSDIGTSPAELNELFTAEGELTQAGLARVRSGLLQAAYEDPNLVAALMEATEETGLNILNAALDSAPRLARLRQQVRAGNLADVDIGPQVAEAIRHYRAMLQQGRSVEDYLAQRGLGITEGEVVGPEAQELMRFFDRNPRSRKRISEALDHYAALAERTAAPGQQPMFEGQTAPTKQGILQQAIRRAEEGGGPRPGQQGMEMGRVMPRRARAREEGRVGPEMERPITATEPLEVDTELQTRTPPPGGPRWPELKVDDIITQMEKAVRAPIRAGRARRGTLGTANYWYRAIRLKRANDIPTGAHESGHILDLSWSLNRLAQNAEIREELLNLGERTSLPSYSNSRKIAEGVAEWTWEWMRDRQAAAEAYPKMSAAFDKFLEQNPRTAKELHTTADMIEQFYSAQPWEQARMEVLSGERASQLRDPARNILGARGKIVRALGDEDVALETAMRFGQSSVWSRRAMQQARLKGNVAAVRAYMVLEEGWFDLEGNKIGPSMADVEARAVRGGHRLEDFELWIMAQHAMRLHDLASGRVPLSPKARQKYVDIIRNWRPGSWLRSPSKLRGTIEHWDNPHFRAASTMLQEWNRHMRLYVETEGQFQPRGFEGRMAQLYPGYVPLAAVIREYGLPRLQRGSKTADLPNVIQRLTGSPHSRVGALHELRRRAYHTIEMAENSKLRRQVADWADHTPGVGWLVEPVRKKMRRLRLSQGEADQLAQQVMGKVKELLEDAGDTEFTVADLAEALREARAFKEIQKGQLSENVISVWRQGKLELYWVHPELIEILTRSNPSSYHWVVRFAGFFKDVQRNLSTIYSPKFMFVRNPARDLITRMMQSPGWSPQIETFFRGFRDIGLGRREFQQMKWAGGAQVQGRGLTMDPDIRAAWADPRRIGPRPQRMRRWKAGARRFVEAGEVIENIPRYMTFRQVLSQMLEEGRTLQDAVNEAAVAARESTVPFERGGTLTKAMNRVVPFFNVRFQGPYIAVRHWAKDPVTSTAKGLFYITLPTVANYLLNEAVAPEDHRRLPAYRKYTGMNMMVGRDEKGEMQYIWIPGPHEWFLAFGSTAIAALERVRREDPQAWKNLVDQAWSLNAPIDMRHWAQDIIPAAARGGITATFNMDWLGRPIVPYHEQRISKRLQAGPRTTSLARYLGRKLNYSPRKVDHLIGEYLGTVGRDVSAAVDVGLAKLGISTRPTADELELLRGILHKASWNPQDKQDFYDRLDRLRKLESEAEHDMYDMSPEDQEWLDRAKRLANSLPARGWTLARIRARRRQVMEDPDMTPEERRRELDFLIAQETLLIANIMGLDPPEWARTVEREPPTPGPAREVR